MNKVMMPITLPDFKVFSEDEKVLKIQEAIQKEAKTYYETYMIEKDRLATKEIFKHLDTKVLEVMRNNITYELRNRKRKKQ